MTTTATFRQFRGNPYITCTAITLGTIASSRTSAAGPEAFFHLSAKNVTCTGTGADGGAINPYEDIEYRWARTAGTTGLNTNAMTWLVALVAGTPESTTRDADVDQVGPECMVRAISTVATTEQWTLTARAADGAGGYITASTTITLTITAPNDTRRFYFDSVAGNNANDARDPWGFNVSGCTFTNSTKRLVKTGAFASYNHTTATTPDKPYRSNYVGIVSGTGVTAGSYEIASKISDDELELVADIGGTNPTNVVLSTGPRQNGDSAFYDSMANNDICCFKSGGSWTLTDYPNGFNRFSGLQGLRILRYGTTAATFVGQVKANIPGATNFGNNVFSGFTLDGNNTETINVLISGSGSGTVSNFYLSNCTLQNCATSTTSSNCNYQDTRCGDGLGWWKCTMTRANAGQHGILAGGTNTSWFFVMGCTISGDGSNATLDHHIYPTFQYNGLFGWNNFGAAANRNYCINTNTALTGSAFAEYVSVVENNLTGTLRACDFSQTSNDYSISRFRKVVVDGNAINGLDGDGQFLFYCCDSMTFRDNIAWGNTGGRMFAPDGQQTSLNLKVYKNRVYTAQAETSSMFELPDTLAAVLFRDNDIWDARSSATTYAFDVDFDGAAVSLSNNRVYTPSRSGNVLLNDGSATTFAAYAAVDTLARSTTPDWTDATTGDLTPTYDPPEAPTLIAQGSELEADQATQATFTWTPSSANANITNIFRIGNATGDYDSMVQSRANPTILTGLEPVTRYYFVMYETDGYDVSSASSELYFETGPEGAPQTDGNRIYGVLGINVDASGRQAWTNPGNVNGEAANDTTYAQNALTADGSDFIATGIPATAIDEVVVGIKLGVRISASVGPAAGSAIAIYIYNSSGVVLASGSITLTGAAATDYEDSSVTLLAGTYAQLKAIIEAGLPTTGSVGDSPRGLVLDAGVVAGSTTFRAHEVWLVPVLAEESSGDVGGDEDAVDDLLLCGGW